MKTEVRRLFVAPRGERPWLLLLAVGVVTSGASAAESSLFRNAAVQGATLSHVSGVPVLVLEGSPEQIGRQTAALTGTAIRQMAAFPPLLVMASGHGGQWAQLQATSRALFEHATPPQRRELDACAQAMGLDRERLIALNTLMDVYASFGCSSLLVDPAHSATGQMLFGRNLDFPLSLLTRYTLVSVYRPQGKRAVASVGFPGVLGVFSGINDAGLALAVHGVFAAGNGTPRFDPQGVPCTMLYRRVLEECATVDAALTMLQAAAHTTALCVVLCDSRGGAVAEVSPGRVAVRRGEGGLCACTNHFRADRNLGDGVCPRYAALRRLAGMPTVGLDDLKRKLHEVNQGSQTIQSMIFEPATWRLYLAEGACPATGQPYRQVDLAGALRMPSAAGTSR